MSGVDVTWGAAGREGPLREGPLREDPLLEEVRAHDRAVRGAGLTALWLGAEPTFTRRDSQEPEWLVRAEGGDKEARARALLEALVSELRVPAKLARAKGRHFPDEPAPRFCLGASWGRGEEGAGVEGADASGLEAAEPLPPPPADPSAAWLTVTPDPGVVEVNLPPAEDLAGFLPLVRATFRAAARAGLSPERFRFNGEATDSGGGGQVTLGGPTPETSPFFLHPRLLPGVLRYLQAHPSLSYAFSTECVGSASQGPRPDEGVRERFEELGVTLARLEARGAAVTREELWESLAPLLVDASGNSHRAEVNVEKLWNPHLGARGLAGLVEFRALRMQPTPERLVALGALLRAVCARVLLAPPEGPLVEWGAALHERFALPHFLAADLAGVLGELHQHGVGLGPRLTRALLEGSALLGEDAPLASLALGGAVLEVRDALEFWPLVGDVASQEKLGARLVDASTRRLELRVRGAGPGVPGRLGACGWQVPLRQVEEGLWVGAVRYRAFSPRPGFHPGLLPTDPVSLLWEHAGAARRLSLHAWRPGGGAYAGLPADAAEARARRAERVVAAAVEPGSLPLRPLPGLARDGALTLDLRRLA
jgi:uncharacterized protein (DUF2126 family)